MSTNTESKNMSVSKTELVDCMICASEVTQNKIVKCPFCNFEACRDCTEQFLMGIDDDKPRCMENNCKKVWGFDFLSSNFKASFHNKKYRDRRATLLYEREKSLLPGTQGLVKVEKSRIEWQEKIDDILDENAMYKLLIKKNNQKLIDLQYNRPSVENGKKNKVFTRACPVEDCRGFLSTGLKCGICSIFACKYCHLPKSCKNDDDHKCDPDLVATVKMLANDTKPCPGCATPIYKIEGCDQMFCTTCHTPFSWLRGTIETGVIHNPHFYEFQRSQNNGVAPRVRGDVRCGGPPPIWNVTNRMFENYIDSNINLTIVENSHRSINHIINVELPSYPNIFGEMDNSSIRVDYLMNRITEKRWISKLKENMKKQEKNRDFNMVLTMYTTTMTDLMGNICDGNKKDIEKYVLSINQLRDYTNKSLKEIGNRYGNIYPFISPSFKFHRNSKGL